LDSVFGDVNRAAEERHGAHEPFVLAHNELADLILVHHRIRPLEGGAARRPKG
jgi:hypothetical protein